MNHQLRTFLQIYINICVDVYIVHRGLIYVCSYINIQNWMEKHTFIADIDIYPYLYELLNTHNYTHIYVINTLVYFCTHVFSC